MKRPSVAHGKLCVVIDAYPANAFDNASVQGKLCVVIDAYPCVAHGKLCVVFDAYPCFGQ